MNFQEKLKGNRILMFPEINKLTSLQFINRIIKQNNKLIRNFLKKIKKKNICSLINSVKVAIHKIYTIESVNSSR